MNDTPHQDWDALISSFNKLIGIKILEWSEGAVTLAVDLDERHQNRSGVAHGGVFMTMMDAAGGYAGCYCPHTGRQRRALSLSLNTSFLAAGRGGRVFARARVRGGGTKIYVSSIEVTDESGTLLALGEGVFRYRTGSEKPEGVPMDATT
jgi:uncharacterized protein (TIGR00369 family)